MISDDTLTLYFYDDGLTPDEKNDIDAALHSDTQLAARYAELHRQLEQWHEADDVKAPEHLLHRWHASIDEAARAETASVNKPYKPFHLLSFAWGGAVMAALALGIGIYFSGDDAAEPQLQDSFVNTTDPQHSAVPASFTRGLQVHLRDSQAGLASLTGDTVDDRNQLLLQIINQNRSFERSADANNAPDVARLLRAFEPILMRLASDDIAAEDSEALRAQLAFELNVMLTKLARTPSDDEQTI